MTQSFYSYVSRRMLVLLRHMRCASHDLAGVRVHVEPEDRRLLLPLAQHQLVQRRVRDRLRGEEVGAPDVDEVERKHPGVRDRPAARAREVLPVQRAETCPVSTGGGTRRVQLVPEGAERVRACSARPRPAARGRASPRPAPGNRPPPRSPPLPSAASAPAALEPPPGPIARARAVSAPPRAGGCSRELEIAGGKGTQC